MKKQMKSRIKSLNTYLKENHPEYHIEYVEKVANNEILSG